MAAVALDLTSVVSILLEYPFDRKALDRVHSLVDGHPQAYATALRCAAKRTSDKLAAAHWLTEAARVHEVVDDLGGAIALLSRAWECDPGNPRTRELLAGSMARLGARIGLGFLTVAVPVAPAGTAPAEDSVRPAPLESGMRPPPPDDDDEAPLSVTAVPVRDTLPGLFGVDSAALSDVDVAPATVRASAPSVAPPTERAASPGASEAPAEGALPSELLTSVAAPSVRLRPSELRAGGAWPTPLRRECRTELPPPPDAPELQDDLIPIPRIGRIGPPPGTRRSEDQPPFPRIPESIEPPLGELGTDDVYGEGAGPPTERPAGDRLVGDLFEILHSLHFMGDVREGAAFVARVIAEKMRPSAILVHLYDINSREFMVVSAHGARAETLIGYSLSEDDPLVVEVMHREEATLVVDPAQDPRFCRGRWLLVEPRRSVLCAPAAVDGRYLGLLEIVDPADGSAFDEHDRNALTYVATTFARFLARLGVVLSEDSGAEHEGLSQASDAAPV